MNAYEHNAKVIFELACKANIEKIFEAIGDEAKEFHRFSGILIKNGCPPSAILRAIEEINGGRNEHTET